MSLHEIEHDGFGTPELAVGDPFWQKLYEMSTRTLRNCWQERLVSNVWREQAAYPYDSRFALLKLAPLYREGGDTCWESPLGSDYAGGSGSLCQSWGAFPAWYAKCISCLVKNVLYGFGSWPWTDPSDGTFIGPRSYSVRGL